MARARHFVMLCQRYRMTGFYRYVSSCTELVALAVSRPKQGMPLQDNGVTEVNKALSSGIYCIIWGRFTSRTPPPPQKKGIARPPKKRSCIPKVCRGREGRLKNEIDKNAMILMVGLTIDDFNAHQKRIPRGQNQLQRSRPVSYINGSGLALTAPYFGPLPCTTARARCSNLRYTSVYGTLRIWTPPKTVMHSDQRTTNSMTKPDVTAACHRKKQDTTTVVSCSNRLQGTTFDSEQAEGTPSMPARSLLEDCNTNLSYLLL